MPNSITIEPTGIGETGQRYRVYHDGRVLLASSRVPLLDACRALLGQGITGRLEMWRAGRSHHDLVTDFERGAAWTVSETRDHVPLFKPWRPFAREGEEDAFPGVRVDPRTAGNDLQLQSPTPECPPRSDPLWRHALAMRFYFGEFCSA